MEAYKGAIAAIGALFIVLIVGIIYIVTGKSKNDPFLFFFGMLFISGVVSAGICIGLMLVIL